MLFGDCVVAAYLHLVMFHNVSSASTWKLLIYRLGYRPPHALFALKEYADFLLTQGEKPGPSVGVDPLQFFTWLKANGKITDFQQIVIGQNNNIFYDPKKNNIIRQAAVDWDGCLLTLYLTKRSYDAGLEHKAWDILQGDVPLYALAHAVAMVAFDPNYNGIVTWAMMKDMTIEYTNYCVYGCWVFK